MLKYVLHGIGDGLALYLRATLRLLQFEQAAMHGERGLFVEGALAHLLHGLLLLLGFLDAQVVQAESFREAHPHLIFCSSCVFVGQLLLHHFILFALVDVF